MPTEEERLDPRIDDKYVDPDTTRKPVSERVKEMLGHNLLNDYERDES